MYVSMKLGSFIRLLAAVAVGTAAIVLVVTWGPTHSSQGSPTTPPTTSVTTRVLAPH